MNATTEEQTEFTYDQLSPRAQEKVREQTRENQTDHDWWDCTYEDAEQVAAFLGIEIDTKYSRNSQGKQVSEGPAIYFSGFWSQGDGACFKGRWDASRVKAAQLREYAGTDTKLHGLADTFQEIAMAYPEASFTVTHSGHYYHKGCTEFTVDLGEDKDDLASACFRLGDAEEVESMLIETARDFMQWIYDQLEAQHDWLVSDEAVLETIEANADHWKFDEDGNIV